VLATLGAGPAFAETAAPGPDLVVEATPGGALTVGVPAERAVTVGNLGGETARDVHVVIGLPAGVRFATALPVFAGGTCSVVSVGSPDGTASFADCVRPSLVAGATATLRMPLLATPDAACGPLVTPVRVSAANEPRANVDHRNHVTIADRLACGSTPGPDLAITVRADAARPLPGRATVTYRLEVTNRGDATSHDASASLSLPGGMRVRGMPTSSSAGPCTVTSSWVPPGPAHMAAGCRIDALEPGSAAVVVVRARVPADPPCADVIAVATVRADDEPRELRGDENRATVTTSWACRPRIQVTAHAPIAAHAGSTVPVTLRVRNVSPAPIVDVRPHVDGCGGSVRRLDGGDGDRILAPRERWTFGCRRPVPTGADPVLVAVEVLARDAARQVTSARTSRRIDVWHPAIALDLSSSTSTEAPGERVALVSVVSNVGDAPLTDVRVSIPSLDVVATVPSLPAGAERTITLDLTLPRRAGSLGEATVTATDRLGRNVVASDDVPLAVTAFTDAADPSAGSPGTADRPGDSAFTGAPVVWPAVLAGLLWSLGVVAIVTGRRRARG
jgi:hypothetical protein